MINAGDVVIRFLGDPTGLERTVGGMESKAKKAGKGAAAGMKPMSAALRGIMKLAGAVGAAFLAWKAVSIFKNMVKAASNFQAEMNKVKALTGAVGKQFDQLREQAMKLGRTTQFSASEAAAGMAFLAQAGFSANEIVKAMPDTLNLAAAAQIDLASAADIVSNVMSGMGIAVEDLGETVDVLTAAFTSANTDLTQLGQAMKFAGPVASDFGLSIAETAGALSLLGNAGIQASMAGTSLRNILNRLVRDGEKFGINIFDSTGKMKSFAGIIEAVDQAALSATERIKLFGDRAGPAMSVFLRTGSKAIREFIEELDDHGIASRIATIQMRGLAGAVKRLESAWEGLQIAIADERMLKMLSDLADATSRFLGRLTLSSEEVARFNEELDKRDEQQGWLDRMLAWGTIVDKNAIETASWLETTVGVDAAMRKLNEAVELNILQGYDQQLKKEAEAAQQAAEAMRRLTEEQRKQAEARALLLEKGFTAPFLKMREEAQKAAEELEKERLKRSLEELDESIGTAAISVDDLLAGLGGLGANMEPTAEQIALLGKAARESGIDFVDMGQQAVLAFAQMAGAASGAGGVMLRIMAMVASQILNQIALRQAEVAATGAAEAGKATITLGALKQIAIVRAVMEMAKGFAALGSFNFWAAAKHFAAAALFGTVGGMQIMAIVGAIGGRKKTERAAAGAGAGAGVAAGGVAEEEEAGPLIVERRMAVGGLITRPTLAMLGERGPEVVVPVGRSAGLGRAAGEEFATVIQQDFHITVEGLISPDNLSDVIQQISEKVRDNNETLQASDSFRTTEK